MIVRSHGYLPHLEVKKATYFVTFRLAGSMPAEVLELWRGERQDMEQKLQSRQPTDFERRELARLFSDRVEEYLDRGAGDCWLKNPEIAKIVCETLKHFAGTRYELHAWCIMPNHVHVLLTPTRLAGKYSSELIPIMHSLKSFTSHQANKILKRTGKFWQQEYYDHKIRSKDDFWFYARYTLENPVKAGLRRRWEDWPWSGCSDEVRKVLCEVDSTG